MLQRRSSLQFGDRCASRATAPKTMLSWALRASRGRHGVCLLNPRSPLELPCTDFAWVGMSEELRKVEALARLAGEAALRFYGTATAEYKDGGSPVTAADHAANECIVKGLRAYFPGDAILSEESKDSLDRLKAERLWIVDPLDGTKEFLAQNGEFAVMIGLAVRGEPVLGVVYLPATQTLYSAERGGGAWVERTGTRQRLVCDHVDRKSTRLNS